MPSTREIRRRIRSVKSIGQVTRAMEMVAASRMRRAQQAVIAGRPYAEKIDEIISHLAARISGAEAQEINPLLEQRPIKKVMVVLVTADRGLAGAFNTNAIRRATRFILDDAKADVELVTVGRKGRDFMVRFGRNVVAEFVNYGDRPGVKPSAADVIPMARLITDAYLSGEVDAVQLVYTDFVNTLVQTPTVYQLLPIQAEAAPDNNTEYIYEPDARTVLNSLVPRYIEARMYQALLESIASEQSARMVAMRNATQASKDMVKDLTLSYNKQRQANITRELIEVSSGAAAAAG